MDTPATTPKISWHLYAARKRLSLSCAEAGRRAGVTGATWANYEPGPTGTRFRQRNRLKPSTIAKLARIVGITPADLRAADAADAAIEYERMWPPGSEQSMPAELSELGDLWRKLDAYGQQQVQAQIRVAREWALERMKLQSTMPREYDLFSDAS